MEGTPLATARGFMQTTRRRLEVLLREVSRHADRIGRQLRRADDWQYPYAVALSAHARVYELRLSHYLHPEAAPALAAALRSHATLCTRALAALQIPLQEAAAAARALQATPEQPSPLPVPLSRESLIRVLLGGGPTPHEPSAAERTTTPIVPTEDVPTPVATDGLE